MDQLPRFGKRELICLLLFICNYVVSVWRGLTNLKYFGIFRPKLANSQYFPLAPFARFIGSLMRL